MVTPADYLMQDAMETAAQSADPEIAEELLHYFVDNNERECFAASLYTCYDLIKPDVAMEVTTPPCLCISYLGFGFVLRSLCDKCCPLCDWLQGACKVSWLSACLVSTNGLQAATGTASKQLGGIAQGEVSNI